MNWRDLRGGKGRPFVSPVFRSYRFPGYRKYKIFLENILMKLKFTFNYFGNVVGTIQQVLHLEGPRSFCWESFLIRNFASAPNGLNWEVSIRLMRTCVFIHSENLFPFAGKVFFFRKLMINLTGLGRYKSWDIACYNLGRGHRNTIYMY